MRLLSYIEGPIPLPNTAREKTDMLPKTPTPPICMGRGYTRRGSVPNLVVDAHLDM